MHHSAVLGVLLRLVNYCIFSNYALILHTENLYPLLLSHFITCHRLPSSRDVQYNNCVQCVLFCMRYVLILNQI